MGFVKIISYSNTLEVYEYEKEIVTLVGKRTRPRKKDAHSDDVGASGTDSFQEGQLGKRSDNARRAALDFRRIVAANLGESSIPILVTLTYRDNFTDLAGAYRHFSSFVQSLRYRYGKSFRYICVPEFQKRGAVHFHALFWGLSKKVLSSERKTRTIAGLWGKGFVFLKETDGNEKLSRYLTKYMAKAFLDPRLKNQKCYTASRNILRPVVQRGPSVNLFLELYGVETEAEVDREFLTRWLGKCRYRIFKTP